MKRIGILFGIAVVFVLMFGLTVSASESLKIQNPGFEEVQSGKADFWGEDFWDKTSGYTKYVVDDKVKHSGKRSGCIINNNANDARYKQTIKVEKDSYYELSCWVKTENVGKKAKGANISVEGVMATSNEVKGTSEGWKKLLLYGKTESDQETMNLTVGIGGYGSINTGTAWFDDISVKKIDKLPVGVNALILNRSENNNSSSNNDSKPLTPEQTTSNNYNILMMIYLVMFMAAVFFIFRAVIKGKLKINKTTIILVSILAAGLIFRLIIAPIIEGWPNDISANKSWAKSAAQGLTDFYQRGWCDYPPFFIYIFYIIGNISNIPGLDSIYTTLIKLPSILADLATAYLLFRVAKKQFNKELGIVAAFVYAFNPAVFLDSTIWGQVDSFFTLIIVSALLMMMEKNIKISAVLFVVAVLMKPQGVFFLPILLFELIKRKNLKDFILSAVYGLVTAIIIILPFSFNQSSPFWIVDLYIGTATEYTSVVMNAFNIFALFGLNLTDGATQFLFLSYNTWGIVLSALVVILAAFFYFKSSHKATPIITAVILNAGAFIFSTKMHERYMFPVIALLLLAIMYVKDKKLLILFAGFNLTIFFNIHILFTRVLALDVADSHFPRVYGFTILFSIINILLYGFLIWFAWNYLIKNREMSLISVGTGGNVKVRPVEINEIESKRDIPKTENIIKTSAKNKKSNKKRSSYESFNGFNFKPISKLILTKNDIIIMCVMTVIYLAVALFNLGSFVAPTTSWQPLTVGEAFTVDFGKEVELSRIYYYMGISATEFNSNKYRLQFEDKNGKYKSLGTIEKGADINKWKYVTVYEKTRRVKVIVDVQGGTLNELAFVEKGSTEAIKKIKLINKNDDFAGNGKIENLFDEQDKLEYNPSLMTSTYFDELYHARTAFEHLHLIEPYETTHPPLGKILIAIGIAIFGMNGFGWRIIGTLFGALMIPLMFMFGKKIFQKTFYGFCAAFLMMFDFMHFAQTRISTIDVYGTFFIMLMYYFMYDYFMNNSYQVGYKQSLKPLFLSGLFFGIGVACKWIVLYGGGGLALLFFMSRYLEYRDFQKVTNRGILKKDYKKEASKFAWVNDFISNNIVKTILWCIPFFIIIPAAIYLMSYIPYMLSGTGHNIADVLQQQKGMFDYHAGLQATHPFSSEWWSWPLDIKSMWYYMGDDVPAGKVSSIVSFGNPAIWWVGAAATIFALILAIRKKEKKMIVVFTAIAFQYCPWMFITRLVFIYHFFSTVPFMMLAMVYVIKYFMEKYKHAEYVVYFYLGIVAALFILFYPVLSGLTVDRTYLEALRWLDSWVFYV